MQIVYPSAAERVAVVSTLAKQFLLRIVLAATVTVVDFLVLMLAGRNVYGASPQVPLLAIAFGLVAIALLLSLTHIWFLTFRVGHMLRSVHLQPKP